MGLHLLCGNDWPTFPPGDGSPMRKPLRKSLASDKVRFAVEAFARGYVTPF